MREVVNAIVYAIVSGVQRRMLPKEYPRWQSVYWYFIQWRKSGLWQRMHDTLRARLRPNAAGATNIRLLGVWTARVSKQLLWLGARLLQWQAYQGPQTPHPGRHNWFVTGCHCHSCIRTG